MPSGIAGVIPSQPKLLGLPSLGRRFLPKMAEIIVFKGF
jgi:hypothetical protein